MVMGQEQEDRILARYINHKQENGHSDISVQKAGFLIDKELVQLGASPHAVANYSSGTGCIEIMAAVSFWDKSISEAASSNNTFCLTTDAENKIHLKRKHAYFHQCQLQLYIGRDMFKFCDFVVATERHLSKE